MSSQDVLNVRAAAQELGVHENTIRNWEKAGLLMSYRLPGSGFRRFPKEEIERMRREMTTQHAPATEMPSASPVTGRTIHGDVL